VAAHCFRRITQEFLGLLECHSDWIGVRHILQARWF
jgi:hypothetical protein